MANAHDDTDTLDTNLQVAGERWRSRQNFEQIAVPTELFIEAVPSRSVAARMRRGVELGAVALVALSVLIMGPLGPRLGVTGGQGTTATPTALPGVEGARTAGPNVAATLGTVDTESLRQAVIAAVASDPTGLGGVYIEQDGTLVIQYLPGSAARASIEAMLVPGISVRWEEVDQSQADLLRIAQEIRDRNLAGVFAIAVDTIHNQVTVSVGSADSLASVKQALSAEYASGVNVVFSDDIFLLQPGGASPSP